MRTIEAGLIQIPFIVTRGNGETPHIPTGSNRDDPIRKKIIAQLNSHEEVLRVGKHAHVILPSVLPHNMSGSSVHWLPEISENHLMPWVNPDSWRELITDTEFLQAYQEYVFHQVDSGHSFYGQFGWAPFNRNPKEYFTPQGGMTIERAHMHSALPLDSSHIEGYLTPQPGMTEIELKYIASFLDFGTQVAREQLTQVNDFSSHQHSWKQMDGLVQRKAYGFLTIQDALSQLLKIHLSLNSNWEDTVKQLYKAYSHEFTIDIGGISRSLLLFSPVVGGALFIPTNDEKKHIGLAQDHTCRVWVSLFSPLMKPNIVDEIHVKRLSK